MFGRNYNYLSGSSPSVVSYFHDFADQVAKRFKLSRNDWVCDIGSNDGSLLKQFKVKGCKVIGVEPTPLPARAALSRGITTVQKYFNKQTAESISRKYGKMKLVTALNVLAHVSDLDSFMKGVKSLLGHDGAFVTQSHYFPLLVEKLEYDTIYHEHLRYYTLATLVRLHAKYGLTIVDAEINNIYGGSIVTYSRVAKAKPSRGVRNLLGQEAPFERLDTYRGFHRDVEINAKRLVKLLTILKKKGKRIVGIGAPMKSSTLLNYCGVGPDVLDYLAEVNPLKIGKYSPGVHIRVVEEEKIFREAPDYALVLSWNMADEIIGKMRNQGYDGKFIVPIPRPHIL